MMWVKTKVLGGELDQILNSAVKENSFGEVSKYFHDSAATAYCQYDTGQSYSKNHLAWFLVLVHILQYLGCLTSDKLK